ncbi:MAG: hypothetical protein EXR85_00945 [Xanthomonadales bacterium]|nr:hypothetical protein [Xanthomonadales bacterium]
MPDQPSIASPALRIKVLPARQGIAWLAQALALIRAQPARLLFLAVLLQLVLGLSRVPVLGLFVILAVPALSAGVLQAFWLVAMGKRFAATVLLAPLLAGAKIGRFMAMGAILFAVAIVSVSVMLSGSQDLLPQELLARIEQGDAAALGELDPELVMRFAYAIAVGVGLSGTLSYLAIPLVWFRDEKLFVSLISGCRAMMLNWRPFTLLALGLVLLLIPVAFFIAILYQLVDAPGALSVLVVGLIMLIALAFQLVVFGTQFCSFQDIYEIEAVQPETGDSDSEGSDGQLLA